MIGISHHVLPFANNNFENRQFHMYTYTVHVNELFFQAQFLLQSFSSCTKCDTAITRRIEYMLIIIRKNTESEIE